MKKVISKGASAALAKPSKPTPIVAPGAAVTASAGATKLDRMISLLRREEGATVAQMQAATGWQAHSVRGALSAAVKRRHGLPLSSTAGQQGRVYRIAAPEQV